MHLMNWGLKPRGRKSIACLVALIMLLSIIGLGSPGTAQAKTDTSPAATEFVVNINDNGEIIPVHSYTIAEMEALTTGYAGYYSSIDSMPAPNITIARGVTLNALVADINQKYNANVTISPSTLKSIRLYATDNWSTSYTYDYLYAATRYYYPELVNKWDKENGVTGPGSDANPIEVEPIFAIYSYQDRFLTDLNHAMVGPSDEGSTTFRFCFGQTANDITNNVITNSRFGRWVNRMDIVLPDRPAAPALTADSSYNKVGKPIDITFTDNEAWRNAITEIKVGDTVLESSHYTKEAGKITIAAGVFATANTYTITVKATDYSDATVIQIINKDYESTALSIKVDNGNPITVTAKQINALNPNNEIRYFSHYKDGQMNYFTGLGAPLAAILSQYASLNSANIASMTVRAADGYYVTFADPQNELFNERYFYPAVGERVQVDTIISTKAAENFAGDISQLDNTYTMRLMMGQTSSEERTISRMVKWVSEIDITTTATINIPVTGVTLNKTATTLVLNHSEQLTALLTPANASKQTVTWTSDKEAVAIVDNTGKVTAVGAGQAVITATTDDGSFTASCTVTVAANPLYKLTPAKDAVYIIGATADGIPTLTVNQGQSGQKYFAVSVEPVISHAGNETVIFTHWRNESELELNAIMADFDVANTAMAGFNVQPGDVIKVYIVDRLTNDESNNPVIFH
jgi:uncharacterized protein YjdB